MIELFTARSGAPSMKVDGVAMHSPYDPTREADRFVQETFDGDLPSTVIVLGDCSGHVTAAVTRARPEALIIAAVYSEEIARAAPLRGAASWHPGVPLTFLEFLRVHLGELQIEGLRVVADSLEPFMPVTSKKILGLLNVDEARAHAPYGDGIKPGHRVNPTTPLFPRIDKKARN